MIGIKLGTFAIVALILGYLAAPLKTIDGRALLKYLLHGISLFGLAFVAEFLAFWLLSQFGATSYFSTSVLVQTFYILKVLPSSFFPATTSSLTNMSSNHWAHFLIFSVLSILLAFIWFRIQKRQIQREYSNLYIHARKNEREFAGQISELRIGPSFSANIRLRIAVEYNLEEAEWIGKAGESMDIDLSEIVHRYDAKEYFFENTEYNIAAASLPTLANIRISRSEKKEGRYVYKASINVSNLSGSSNTFYGHSELINLSVNEKLNFEANIIHYAERINKSLLMTEYTLKNDDIKLLQDPKRLRGAPLDDSIKLNPPTAEDLINEKKSDLKKGVRENQIVEIVDENAVSAFLIPTNRNYARIEIVVSKNGIEHMFNKAKVDLL
jgi:hypothetical protein